MKKTTYITAILLTLAVASHAAEVLCVGLNAYSNNAKYKNLKCATNDAATISAQLTKEGHSTTLLINESATRDNILKAMSDDDVVVYFAGHGEKDHIVVADGTISLEELSGRCKTLILDCCYVGGSVQKKGKTQIMAAAQYEAFESDGHGLFTKYLLKWLAKGETFAGKDMLENIRKGIRRETGGWQNPVLGYI
jgi:hypothetical protein